MGSHAGAKQSWQVQAWMGLMGSHAGAKRSLQVQAQTEFDGQPCWSSAELAGAGMGRVVGSCAGAIWSWQVQATLTSPAIPLGVGIMFRRRSLLSCKGDADVQPQTAAAVVGAFEIRSSWTGGWLGGW